MTTLYDLLDRPEPADAVRDALEKAAEHFERMSEREHANGNHKRAGALRDCALYLRQMEDGKCQ